MTLTERQLKELKNDLLTMKENLKDQTSLDDSLDINTDEASVTDNHMADSATEYVDRQTQIAETNLNKEQLKEIDEALERMRKGTYGICIDTGKEIPFERLKAIPYTKRTIQAEKKHKNQTPANEDEDTTRLLKPKGEIEDSRKRTLETIEEEHNSQYKPDGEPILNENPDDQTY